MDPTPTLGAHDSKTRMNSWKEIANYFHRDSRTVQLWEKNEGLPVHRHEHLLRASVHAYPAELDAWFKERARKRGAEPAAPILPEDSAPAASRAWKPFLLLLLTALLSAAGWFAWRAVHRTFTLGNGTIVVLPFLNLTGDAGQDYLSDGLTDELTTLLASER
jgi:hypothetical protein